MLDPLGLSVSVDRRAVPSDVLCLDARSLMRTWGGVKEQQEEEDRGGGKGGHSFAVRAICEGDLFTHGRSIRSLK